MLWRCALLLLLAPLAVAQTTITDGPISWTISQTRSVGAGNLGQYCTGDWWVVGPVTVTGISPAPGTVGSRVINGSMLTPSGSPNGFVSNGWDTMCPNYSAAKNVALSLPIAITTGSLMSAKSFETPPHTRRPLSDMRVLTVVAAAPAPNSFRPPYCGTDKVSRWTLADLDYSILPRLAPVANSPTPAGIAVEWESGPWIEVDTHTNQRETHPYNNMTLGANVVYGREIGRVVSRGLLTLCLDYSDAAKQGLYMRMVQYGIDIYGTAKSGGQWPANGGYNGGRKGAILLAGLALGDADILDYADKAQHFIFQDDQQYWIVSQADVGRYLRPSQHNGYAPEPYTQGMVGMPEWGIEHATQPENDTAGGQSYRSVNFDAHAGYALAARLIAGMQAANNWDPPYRYYDRAFGYETGDQWRTPFPADTTTPEAFVKNMWAAYRSSGVPAATQAATPVATPGGTAFQSPVTVTLTSAPAEAQIRYTTNGSTPTGSSALYTAPIAVSTTTTIRAIAIAAGLADSAVMTETYVLGPYSVTSAWAGAALEAPQTQDFTISWKMTPSAASMDMVVGLSSGVATTYAGYATIVRFNASGFIDAYNGTGYAAVSSLAWTNGTPVLVEMSVNMTARTYSVTVTPDGGSPTVIATNYGFRAQSTSLSHLSFRALVGSGTVDNITLGSAQVPAAAPSLSPASGNYAAPPNIVISTNESGGTTRYTITTNGSAPAEVTESSTAYSAPIVPAAGSTVRIRARTYAAGRTVSAPIEGQWVVDEIVIPPEQLSTVLVNNAGGAYAGPTVAVTPLNVAAGATAYYTLNGTAPTTSSTAWVGGAITVTPPATLRIFQAGSGYANSPIASYNYVLSGAEPDPDDVPVSDPDRVTRVALPSPINNRGSFLVQVSIPNTSVRGWIGTGAAGGIVSEDDMDMGIRINASGYIEAIDGTLWRSVTGTAGVSSVAVETGTMLIRYKRNPTNYSLWVRRPSDGTSWVQIAQNYSFGAAGTVTDIVARASSQSFTIEAIDANPARVVIVAP